MISDLFTGVLLPAKQFAIIHHSSLISTIKNTDMKGFKEYTLAIRLVRFVQRAVFRTRRSKISLFGAGSAPLAGQNIIEIITLQRIFSLKD